MLHEGMNCDLFVELSDEQQQLVAGGTSIGELQDKLATFYKTNTFGIQLDVVQASTPQGSFNQQNFTTEVLNINTGAFKDLLAKLN
jgi:hypothetical protein